MKNPLKTKILIGNGSTKNEKASGWQNNCKRA